MYRLFKKLLNKPSAQLNVAIFNSRSICNKTVGVIEYLTDLDTDVCFISETWLRKGDTSKIKEIKELGFNIIHKSRAGKGGGVAFIFKKGIRIICQKTKCYKSFEVIEGILESNTTDILRISCIYRPGTGKYGKVVDFCSEFEEYLSKMTHLPGRPLIAGDFNIHMEDPDNPDTKKFQALINSFGFRQSVNEPTHICEGILDLVLTCDNICDTIKLNDINVINTSTSSDHYLVSFSCIFSHDILLSPKISRKTRSFTNLDMESFRKDILNSKLNDTDLFNNVEGTVLLYNDELCTLLDKHAPFITVKFNPEQSRWLNAECQEARRQRRKAERKDRKNKTAESRIAWVEACKHASEVITCSRDNYYSNQLNISAKDKKKSYSIVYNLLDRNISKASYPVHKPIDTVTHEMKEFFHSKVANIYANIEKTSKETKFTTHDYDVQSFSGSKYWNCFQPIDSIELHEIIKLLNTKHCELDPIPSSIFVQCLSELESIVLYIVNTSLEQGRFPESLKNAMVKPSIKDSNGDVNDYKNYRPISNLPYMSKIIEKAVQRQLEKHLEKHNLHAMYQSGYRAGHSCETATLTVYNDLLCLSDVKSKVILLLLDLSAAFDTINHSILLRKLYNKFGITGTVLQWFESYLDQRSFTVTINESKSERCFLVIGVPQGSILGPILFILYTKELESIARKHGLPSISMQMTRSSISDLIHCSTIFLNLNQGLWDA